MNKSDVVIGMKVIPNTKSLGCGLTRSSAYQRMKKNNQEFLYVTHQHMDDKIHNIDRFLLSDDKNHISLVGDYFKSSDFEPYVDNWDTLITNATSEEERQEWKKVKGICLNWGLGFKNDWTLEMYQQKYGCLEILQNPPVLPDLQITKDEGKSTYTIGSISGGTSEETDRDNFILFNSTNGTFCVVDNENVVPEKSCSVLKTYTLDGLKKGVRKRLDLNFKLVTLEEFRSGLNLED